MGSEPADAPLRLVLCGSVDHGKSTLVGRLLHETGALPAGRIEAVRGACERRGVAFEWAFLTDALQAERDQNVTIDAAHIEMRTAQRRVRLIDAPGHEEFLRNMITGAAGADAALLLVAADEGWRGQSRRHAWLLGLLGLRQVAVVVNKMDAVAWDEGAFRRIVAEGEKFLAEAGLAPVAWVPVSAREGEGVTRWSDHPALAWSRGTSVAEVVDGFVPASAPEGRPLRFTVQDVWRQDARRIVVGRVETGRVQVGDAVTFWPFHREATVTTIERWPEPGAPEAGPGECVGLTLAEPVFVERGHVMSHRADAPLVSNRARASVFWLGATDLAADAAVRVKLGAQSVAARVAEVRRAFDPARPDDAPSGGAIPRRGAGEVTLQFATPLAFDPHARIEETGRFVLLEGEQIAGGGVITETAGGAGRGESRGGNVTETLGRITAAHRAARHGHRGGVVWCTGLSGAGKSTLARAAERELWGRGWQVCVLDGDNLRRGLNADLTFSPSDRLENNRRAAEAARLLAEAGLAVIVAIISPYRAQRELARRVVLEGGDDFFEVFVRAPLAVCEQRDPKGLYAKVRAGQIKEFTGVDAPYEEPEAAELVLATDALSEAEGTERLIQFIVGRLGM